MAARSRSFKVRVVTVQYDKILKWGFGSEHHARWEARNYINTPGMIHIYIIHPGGWNCLEWNKEKGDFEVPARGTMAGSQQGDYANEEIKLFLVEADVPFDIRLASGPDYNETLSERDKKGQVVKKVYNHNYTIALNSDSHERIAKAMQVGSVPVFPDNLTLSFSINEKDLDDPENFRVVQFNEIVRVIEEQGIAHNACLVKFTSRQWNKTGYKLDWWFQG